MNSLPVPVSDDDIMEMFQFADKDDDGKLSYAEFLVKTFIVRDKILKPSQTESFESKVSEITQTSAI